jgi:hypothetical protein
MHESPFPITSEQLITEPVFKSHASMTPPFAVDKCPIPAKQTFILFPACGIETQSTVFWSEFDVGVFLQRHSETDFGTDSVGFEAMNRAPEATP